MSDQRIPISQLSETQTAPDASYIAIDDGSLTKKITVENFNSTSTASAQQYANQAAASAQTVENNIATSAAQIREATLAAREATQASTSATASATSAYDSASLAQNYSANASTSAGQAMNAADSAAQNLTASKGYAEDSEAWAVGQRNGSDVPASDETYQNNAKYYANSASGSATRAETAAQSINVPDTTLTVSGFAADSKATGDRISAADAELADIRVMANGTTAATAGDAVREQVTDLKSAVISETGNDIIKFIEKYAYNTAENATLGRQRDNDSDCLKISCNAGDVFTVRGEGWVSFELWAFYGDIVDNKYPRLTHSGMNAKTDYTLITAPTDAKYFVMNVKRSPQTYAGFCCTGIYLPNRLEALEKPVSFDRTDFFERNHSLNLFDRNTYTAGRLESDGTIDSTATAYFTTDYIDLHGLGGAYVVPVMSSATNIGCSGFAFYDENKVFISGSDSSIKVPKPIPEKARYYKCSYVTGAIYTFGVFVNNTQTGSDNKIYYDEWQIGRENVNLAGWYAGKKASALGDSITENGNSNSSGTHSAWRRMVAEKLHLTDEIVNCGIGGTRVSGTNENAMWQDVRINSIPADSDVVFFNGGMNDWIANAPLGDTDSSDTSTFYGALNVIAQKLISRMPNAIIFWMTTTYGQYPAKTNTLGLSTYDYGRAIKEVAEKHGFPVIDLHALCGWNQYNIATYVNEETVNGNTVYIHPNLNGGKKMTTAICHVIESYQPM